MILDILEFMLKYILLLLLLSVATPVFSQDPVSSNADKTVIEGVLLQVSKLPRPEGNAYPDCYYTAIIDIKQIISGQSIPKKIILVLPGFFARQYAPEAGFKTGDKIRVAVVPFASMSDKIRQTQQADEIEDVDLEFFYPEETSRIEKYQQISSLTPFASKPLKAAEASKLQPIDFKARAARKESMRRDLEQINKLLADHGGDWDAWYNSLQEFRTQYNKQFQAKAQRWIGDSFFSAGELPHGKMYSPEFLKSVIKFKNFLAEHNVDLILVRFPFKGEIVDDLFAPLPPDQVSNPYLLRLYKELLEADVEVVTDVIPRAKENRLKYPLMYWYQDFPEAHPAGGMVWEVAEALKLRLERYERIKTGRKESFTVKQASAASMSRPASKFTVWSNNVFWPAGNPKFSPEEYVQFPAIITSRGKALGLQQGLDSPVLLVGSSFVRYPSMELGATLTTYLADLTGIVPDALARLGSDQTIPRTIAREGDSFLKNRSVCIFPMTPWTFQGPLDSPPILNPNNFSKILLTSTIGYELKKFIPSTGDTPKHVFTFSKENDLTVEAADKTSRVGVAGVLKISLPSNFSSYPYFMVEMKSRPGDVTEFSASYETQSNRVQKFYSQTNFEDYFIFKSGKDNFVNLDIKIMDPNFPTVINSVKIFGIQK